MPPRVSDEQLSFARTLRSSMTVAETALWRALRNRGVKAKFRRQVPIGPYVADFACVAARLVVEVDGATHVAAERKFRDEERNLWLAAHGWRVLRFAGEEVLAGADIVVDRVRAWLPESPHPTLANARATFSRVREKDTP